jgi:putative inorganic carbon (hco3(-)) transporter
MPTKREPLVFALVLCGAAALLVSIAAGEILLAAALVSWLVWQPQRPRLPSYITPLCAFILTTFLSLAVSPDPAINWALRKTVLFGMTLMAATFVTTRWRARTSYALLLAFATITSVWGLLQFGIGYARFLGTEKLSDDPTVLARITGFMGHWLTFSGEQLLVWCAAVPAMMYLGKRWIVPLTIVGAALILSFTQSVWLGAAAGVGAVAVMLPRRLLLAVVVPLVLMGVVASPLIYQRLNRSLGDPDFAPRYGRLTLWKAGARMIRDHPWFGVGPERVPTEFLKMYRGSNLANIYYGHLENNFLQIAAERGLICFAAFLWFLIELYAGLLRLLKVTDEGTRWTVLSAISALTGFVVSGLFQYNFGDSEVLLLLLFIVSIPFGVLHEPIKSEYRVVEKISGSVRLDHT